MSTARKALKQKCVLTNQIVFALHKYSWMAHPKPIKDLQEEQPLALTLKNILNPKRRAEY